MDLVDGITESNERGNDGPSACSKHQIKSTIQRAIEQRLDFFEYAQRVKALCSTPIERKNATDAIGLVRAG
jgi:hypothetical protein